MPAPTRPEEEIFVTRNVEAEIRFLMKTDPDYVAKSLGHWDRALFCQICRENAEVELPAYLAALCIQQEKSFDAPWFFPGIVEALIRLIDERAEAIKAGLVMTEVMSQIFDALDYTYAMKKMTQIRGSSRFGKTEGLRTHCFMWPGRERLVTVPSSNSQQAFLRAIAEALGMDTSYGSDAERLRGRIRDVLNQTGIFLIFDEAAFLIPRNYTKTTPPYRMDFVRTELFDRGLPVALGVTPQQYEAALAQYTEVTKYAFEQFEGRCQTLELPKQLEEADLLMVAKSYFPKITRKADLLDVASYASSSENGLQAIRDIADRARYISQLDRAELGMDEVNAAIAWLFPKQATYSQPIEAPCRGISAPVKPVLQGVQSVRSGATGDRLLDSCAVRGAGLQLVSTKPILIET